MTRLIVQNRRGKRKEPSKKWKTEEGSKEKRGSPGRGTKKSPTKMLLNSSGVVLKRGAGKGGDKPFAESPEKKKQARSLTARGPLQEKKPRKKSQVL